MERRGDYPNQNQSKSSYNRQLLSAEYGATRSANPHCVAERHKQFHGSLFLKNNTQSKCFNNMRFNNAAPVKVKTHLNQFGGSFVTAALPDLRMIQPAFHWKRQSLFFFLMKDAQQLFRYRQQFCRDA